MKIGENNSSSIENIDDAIALLFNRILLIESTSNIKFFEESFDTELSSYYEPLKNQAYSDYSFIDTSTKESFQNSLNKFWTIQGNTELCGLTSNITELAFQLKDNNLNQSTDLSPFIYTMY